MATYSDDNFVGEIKMFGFNFPPTGWAFCNGQLLPISQNTPLFSLLGTTYGGDGRVTFALPDLKDRAAMHVGYNQPGPGLSIRYQGETGGSETTSLLISEIPVHTHVPMAKAAGNVADPSGLVWGNVATIRPAPNFFVSTLNPNPGSDTFMSPTAISPAGGNFPHNNMMPYLSVNFCIALQGIFPQRP